MKKLFEESKVIWLGYPALAIMFILISLNFLVNSSAQILNFSGRQQSVVSEEERISRLQTKLDVLKQVNIPVETENLVAVAGAVPAAKKGWLLTAQIRNAINSTNSLLDTYGGKVGDIREATAAGKSDALLVNVSLSVDSFEELATIVTYLETQQPLVKINKVDFEDTDVAMVVEGAWSPWGKVGVTAELPLPNYKANMNSLTSRLGGFGKTEVPVSELVANENTNANPF